MFFLLPLYVLGSCELKEIFVFYFALESIQTSIKFQSLPSQDLFYFPQVIRVSETQG